MGFLKGQRVSGRLQVRHGLDFTQCPIWALGSNAEIKLKNSQLIDGQTAGYIYFKDDNSNELLSLKEVASAVNYPEIYGNATGSGVYLEAKGGDTNIDVVLKTKGSGLTKLDGFDENFVIGLKGTVAVGSCPHNELTLTALAAAYAKVYDDSASEYQALSGSSSGAGYTNDMQCFPDTEAADDYVMFGADAPFGILYIDVSATNGTFGDDACKWQYYDGSAWQDLTIIYDGTDSTANDGKRPFQQDGYLVFSAPSDWASATFDSQAAYWIRSIVTAAQITQIPVLADEPDGITAPAASEAPADGTIGRGRVTWTTKSGTDNDTKCVLMNLTTGECSAEKTITGGELEDEIANFALDVSKDDQLVMFYTQEDETTEFANGLLELRLQRSYS
jgi:hypothetical protein